MMLLWEYLSCSSVAGLESVIFTSFFSSLAFFLSVGEGKVFEILRVTKGSMLRKKKHFKCGFGLDYPFRKHYRRNAST